jgi:hypothetical protein
MSWLFYQGVERPRVEIGHSSLSIADVRRRRAKPSLPYTPFGYQQGHLHFSIVTWCKVKAANPRKRRKQTKGNK